MAAKSVTHILRDPEVLPRNRAWVFGVTWRPIAIGIAFTLGAWLLFAPLYIGTAILILDTRSRFLDYQRFKGKRFTEKLAREMGKSWCGRGVAETIWPQAVPYYRSQGYRMWHIFPDGFPLVFLDLRFIKSVLGIGK